MTEGHNTLKKRAHSTAVVDKQLHTHSLNLRGNLVTSPHQQRMLRPGPVFGAKVFHGSTNINS